MCVRGRVWASGVKCPSPANTSRFAGYNLAQSQPCPALSQCPVAPVPRCLGCITTTRPGVPAACSAASTRLGLVPSQPTPCLDPDPTRCAPQCAAAALDAPCAAADVPATDSEPALHAALACSGPDQEDSSSSSSTQAAAAAPSSGPLLVIGGDFMTDTLRAGSSVFYLKSQTTNRFCAPQPVPAAGVSGGGGGGGGPLVVLCNKVRGRR